MAQLLLVVLAWAVPMGTIETRDVAGSEGNWQEGRAVIPAPLDDVRGWLLDLEHWPQIFPDVTSAKVLARPAPDRATIRFRSRVAGRELTIAMRWNARGISYRGAGKNVDVQGKIYLTPLDARHTQVVMQSTADVHGLVGALASPGMKRSKAFKKLRADLGALEKLAGARM
jgi:Polyketide cyclase / dehydrase and lipid transport